MIDEDAFEFFVRLRTFHNVLEDLRGHRCREADSDGLGVSRTAWPKLLSGRAQQDRPASRQPGSKFVNDHSSERPKTGGSTA